MIGALTKGERARQRHLARRKWHAVFVPIAILTVQGFGRTIVCARSLETRWSDTHRRRLWWLPAMQIQVVTR